jgi:capsular polysaccharide biosynthesis protein
MRSIVPRSAGPWLAVVTLTAAGAAAAVGYGLTAPKRYSATAQLLVSPVSVSDPTFTGLDVLRDTGGKRTAAASAAALLRSPQVADQVRAALGLARSRDSLLSSLHSHVVDSSDVVAVTVEDTSAPGSAQLANAFADALVKERTAGFQSQLATTIRRDEQLLAAMTPAQRTAGVGGELARRLVSLHGFQGQPDPTIRHAGEASAPANASWPRLPKLAAVGAGAGLAAGVLVALVLLLGRFGGRKAVVGAPYDRGVSERLVQRLEERVAERIAALEAEREKLSAREAALAARERDVVEKLAELRAAAEGAPPPPPPDIEPAPAPAAPADAQADAERANALDHRVRALTQREIALARRAAESTAREAALDARTAELDRRAEELAAQAAELERLAEERSRTPEPASLPAPAPRPAPVEAAPAAPVAAPPAAGPAVDENSGRWNLLVLERLINDRAQEFPDRVDEWSSYLYFLREYAEPDGSVPASFDWLIADTFGDLVA